MSAAIGRALRAFGHFWWDFLIGDTPEVAVAAAVLVGLAFLLAHQRAAISLVLPLSAGLFLVGSALRGRRPSKTSTSTSTSTSTNPDANPDPELKPD
jgi:hypothetical protein